ncbi:hypothetical protein ACIRPX_45055 [Streptomyces sp. NPDC101225]|uniref:hypothetical protein n=1 Tax=Streptomyces sp. NPDC101225 TaxID=3366135 RepID=UPI003807CBCA
MKETDDDAEEALEGPRGAPEANLSSGRSSPARRLRAGGGAQIYAGQQLLSEGEFVVGDGRVGEGQGEGAVGLAVAALIGDAVVFGFVACCGVRGGAVHGAVGPPDVAFDAVMAAFPAQGVGGGEVAGHEVVPVDASTSIDAARAQHRRQAAVTEAAALRRARADRATRSPTSL